MINVDTKAKRVTYRFTVGEAHSFEHDFTPEQIDSLEPARVADNIGRTSGKAVRWSATDGKRSCDPNAGPGWFVNPACRELVKRASAVEALFNPTRWA